MKLFILKLLSYMDYMQIHISHFLCHVPLYDICLVYVTSMVLFSLSLLPLFYILDWHILSWIQRERKIERKKERNWSHIVIGININISSLFHFVLSFLINLRFCSSCMVLLVYGCKVYTHKTISTIMLYPVYFFSLPYVNRLN